MKMMSSIGSKGRRGRKGLMMGRIISKKGFTFIEVMVTVAILAAGITMIYRALIATLDLQTHLVHRMYAVHLLDQKAAELQSSLYFEDASLFNYRNEDFQVSINNRKLAIETEVALSGIGEAMRFVGADLSLHWSDRKRNISMTRSFYLLGNDWEALKP